MSTPKATMPKKYMMTPDEMWNVVKGTGQNWGIEGYEVPRKYLDHLQMKWEKQREQIKKEHKSQWPPKDWPKDKEGNPHMPTRINFIDETQKWANSFNDEAKSKENYEKLEPKGIFNPPKKKEHVDARKKFLDDEASKKEKMAALPKIQEWKVEPIAKAEENIKKDLESRVTEREKNLKRYTKDKPHWPRCDRVSVMCEAEYIGEIYPFYNTFTKEGESADKNKLFFPKKDYTWTRAPIWTFDNKKRLVGMNDQMKAREALINEKRSNYMTAKNLKDENLWLEVDRAEKLIIKRGRYPLAFMKEFDYKTDQYKKNREEHPEYSPGPDAYWKMKPGTQDINVKPGPPDTISLPGGKEGKSYYLNHKRTDFVSYKPLRGSVY